MKQAYESPKTTQHAIEVEGVLCCSTEASMKHCSNCGQIVSKFDNYCSNCGKAL